MTKYIETKYIHLISNRLRNFKQKGQELYNFSCPFCGDSEKNKLKARGYLYVEKGEYRFKCHNCSHNCYLLGLIDKVDYSLHKEYVMETFIKPKEVIEDKFEVKIPKNNIKFTKKQLSMEPLIGLPEGHSALTYIESRCIPKAEYKHIFYAPDFKLLVDEFLGPNEKEIPHQERIILPFYDENKMMVGFQGRSYDPKIEKKYKYISILLEGGYKFYGMDKINENKPIYVVEGAFDSMFIPNCIAVSDSNLASAERYFPKENLILVPDNQPRNKEICKLIQKNINNGFQVVIWPDYLESKDINDMYISGMSQEKILGIINDNIYSNIEADLKFTYWKKC